MKLLLSAIMIALFSAAHSQAILYPQRAGTPNHQGFNIDAGRDYQPLKRPISTIPVASAYSAPALPFDVNAEWIDVPMPYNVAPALTAPAEAAPTPNTPAILETASEAIGSLSHNVDYKGNVEAGAQLSTGNSETLDYNLAAKLTRESQDWTNIFRASLANQSAEDVTNQEEYRAGLESQYKLSPAAFLFGEIDYVDDRFAGFDYRISEVFGYGRKWFNDEGFQWSSKAGAGFQHIKERDSKREDSPLGRIENSLLWDITDRLGFENHIEVDFSDLTSLRTETSVKNHLYGNLFLKLTFITEYLSDVPAGNEHLDTDTLLNLSYEFD